MGSSPVRRSRWGWIVVAVVLALASAATALIGQCSQASGPPVCVRYAPAVAPLALAALAIVAAVMAVRPSRHARR